MTYFRRLSALACATTVLSLASGASADPKTAEPKPVPVSLTCVPEGAEMAPGTTMPCVERAPVKAAKPKPRLVVPADERSPRFAIGEVTDEKMTDDEAARIARSEARRARAKANEARRLADRADRLARKLEQRSRLKRLREEREFRSTPQFDIRTERFSPGMMGTGIPFLVIGGVNLIAGLAATADANSSSSSDCYDYNCSDSSDDDQGVRTAALVAGGAMTAAGLILTIVGSKKVQVIKPRTGSLAPSVRIGANGADLKWRF